MLPYVLPFRYLYISRFARMSELFSLLWIYPLYLTFVVFVLYETPLVPNLGSFVIGFVAWMAIYEIGYMENDAITTFRERFPNFRISKDRISVIQQQLKSIILYRVIIFIALVTTNLALGWWSIWQLGSFVSCVLLARIFFMLHNRIRSTANVATYLGLCLVKYGVFILVYLHTANGWQPYLLVTVSFVLLRTLEHSTKEKYGLHRIQNWVGSLDDFRVRYYTVAFLLAALSYLFLGVSPIFVLSLGYFLVFRGAIWLLIKQGVYSRQPG